MGSVLKKLYGPVLGLIVDGKKGFIQGLGNAATAYFGGPLAVFTSVSSAFAKSPKSAASSAADRNRLNANIDPRAPRTIVYGRTAMATDIRDQEFTGSKQEYLHRFMVVASHKVQAIEEIYFDDKLAWTVAGGVQGEFVGYLDVAPILEGSAGNAINISARMGSTRRYTGLAYIHFRYKLTGNSKKSESPFAQNVPTRVTIVGKGMACYDPRLDSTVPGGSGTQRADNQATWVWNDSASRNPALQLLNYLLGYRINGLLAVGKGIPPSRLDLASFITAANICDETVALSSGGSEPRYRTDGVFSEFDDMTLVLDQFKQSMNAVIDDADGLIRVTVLHNDLASPIATFGPDDVIGSVQWNPVAPLDERPTVVRGTFTDPSTTSLYQSVIYPEVVGTSFDGIERPLPLDFPIVQSPSQCQRLARMRVRRAQYAGTFAAVFQFTAWRAQKNDIIRLNFPALGFVNKIFRVIETGVRLDGTVPMLLREENAEIYSWAAEEQAAIAPVASTVYDYLNNPINQGINESAIGTALAGSYTSGLSGNITQADNGAGAVTVTIPTHTRVYPAPYDSVSVTGGTLTFAYSEFALIYYDDATLAGGAVTYGKTSVAADGYFSSTNPFRHFVGFVTAINGGGTGGGTGGGSPPGGGGWTGGGGGGSNPIP